MSDGTILPRGVDALEYDKHRPGVFRIEPPLKVNQPLDKLCEVRLSLASIESGRFPRVEILQAKGTIAPTSMPRRGLGGLESARVQSRQPAHV